MFAKKQKIPNKSTNIGGILHIPTKFEVTIFDLEKNQQSLHIAYSTIPDMSSTIELHMVDNTVKCEFCSLNNCVIIYDRKANLEMRISSPTEAAHLAYLAFQQKKNRTNSTFNKEAL